ncbi:hypothetical protein Aperf_G00000071644 [Anoplocephala perfoliata]
MLRPKPGLSLTPAIHYDDNPPVNQPKRITPTITTNNASENLVRDSYNRNRPIAFLPIADPLSAQLTCSLMISSMQPLLVTLLVLLSVNSHLKVTWSGSINITSGADEELMLSKGRSEPMFDASTFEHIKEKLKMEHKLKDVVLAVINSSTVLRCRPEKNMSNANGHNPIKFIWRRLEQPTYLTFNYRRISLDKRYRVVMADLNEFKMDLNIENVTPSDEGEYICLYTNTKLVHEKRVYLKVLVPSSICPNGSSNTKVAVREGLTQKLTCNVSGVPTPVIRWYMSTKDGKERRVISTEDQQLRPVVKMGAQILHRKPYQTTMIYATVVGNPIHSLYWEFDHKPIPSVSGDCFFTLSGDKYCVVSVSTFGLDREIANPMIVRTKLTIYNLTLEDYGTYTCVVHSPFGAERGSTELVRKKERYVDTAKSAKSDFFPGLWNPSSWRNNQPDYVPRKAFRTTTSGTARKSSPIILSTCFGLTIFLFQLL